MSQKARLGTILRREPESEAADTEDNSGIVADAAEVEVRPVRHGRLTIISGGTVKEVSPSSSSRPNSTPKAIVARKEASMNPKPCPHDLGWIHMGSGENDKKGFQPSVPQIILAVGITMLLVHLTYKYYNC